MTMFIRILSVIYCIQWVINALLIAITDYRLSEFSGILASLITAFFFYGLSRADYKALSKEAK